jgi:hypothetical protein
MHISVQGKRNPQTYHRFLCRVKKGELRNCIFFEVNIKRTHSSASRGYFFSNVKDMKIDFCVFLMKYHYPNDESSEHLLSLNHTIDYVSVHTATTPTI